MSIGSDDGCKADKAEGDLVTICKTLENLHGRLAVINTQATQALDQISGAQPDKESATGAPASPGAIGELQGLCNSLRATVNDAEHNAERISALI